MKKTLNIKPYLDGRTLQAVSKVAFPKNKHSRQELHRHMTRPRKSDYPKWLDRIAKYLGVDREVLIVEYKD